MGVVVADPVNGAIDGSLFVEVARPSLAEGAVCNFGKGSNRTGTERSWASEVKKLQVPIELDSCHLFVFDFNNPTIAKVFHQAAGEGEPCIVDSPLRVVSRFTCGGDLLMVETVDGAIVAEGERLGVMAGGVKDPQKIATRGKDVMEWVWSPRWGRWGN